MSAMYAMSVVWRTSEATWLVVVSPIAVATYAVITGMHFARDLRLYFDDSQLVVTTAMIQDYGILDDANLADYAQLCNKKK